jgi:hypothetical protein
MVDFTTPNLCGASEQFNKLANQFSSIKDSLQGSLEGEIDALKSELTASLAILETDIKGLIPELPEIPDISLISEIQNLIALPAGSFASLSALANIKAQFGDALDEAGFALDSLVSDATAAFSGGIDLCGGGLPNFVIGPNGIPTLKPEDAGMPDGDPVGETISSLKTSFAEIGLSNESVIQAQAIASEQIQKLTKDITIDISAERGNISNAVKEAFDQADTLARLAAAEAKIPTTPQVAKVKSAVAATTNLPLAPAAPASAATAAPVVNTSGTSPLAVGEIEAKLKVIQDSISSAVAERNRMLDKLVDPGLVIKGTKSHPHNLISADRKMVNNKSKKITIDRVEINSDDLSDKVTVTLEGISRYYTIRLVSVNSARKRVEKSISGLLEKLTKSGPDPAEDSAEVDYIKEAADKVNDDYAKLSEDMEKTYVQAKKAFSVPVSAP